MKSHHNNKNNHKQNPKRNFITKSIQNQILIPFLILITFASGAIALVSSNFSIKNTTNELTKNVENQMVTMNDTFEMFFGNTEGILERFTSNDLLMNYNSKTKGTNAIFW